MKWGPLTFQWACLVCVCKSMASANLALSSSIALPRIVSDRSFFVLNMLGLLVEAFEWIWFQNQQRPSLSMGMSPPGPRQPGLRYATLAKCQRRRVLKTEAY